MRLGVEKIKFNDSKEEFVRKTESGLTSGKKFETAAEQESESEDMSEQQRIQELTKEVEALRVAMEAAEGAYLEAKNKHDGVFRQFKSMFVPVTLGEAEKEQSRLRENLNSATRAYKEKLAILETGMEEVDKFYLAAGKVIEQTVPEVRDEKIKKTRARKPKKVEAEGAKEEKNHFAVFQKHVSRGKAALAIKAFRKALAQDVSWKELKKLTLGQAVLKGNWHENDEIKDFLHNLKEMLGGNGAAKAGETLHEWTQRLSHLALEQAGDEEEIIQ